MFDIPCFDPLHEMLNKALEDQAANCTIPKEIPTVSRLIRPCLAPEKINVFSSATGDRDCLVGVFANGSSALDDKSHDLLVKVRALGEPLRYDRLMGCPLREEKKRKGGKYECDGTEKSWGMTL